jgi:hypothetical protein
LIFKTDKQPTNYSIIFLAKEKNSILSYRGASGSLSLKNIPIEKLKTKWFYFAPLSGNLINDFLKIIDAGKSNA